MSCKTISNKSFIMYISLRLQLYYIRKFQKIYANDYLNDYCTNRILNTSIINFERFLPVTLVENGLVKHLNVDSLIVEHQLKSNSVPWSWLMALLQLKVWLYIHVQKITGWLVKRNKNVLKKENGVMIRRLVNVNFSSFLKCIIL